MKEKRVAGRLLSVMCYVLPAAGQPVRSFESCNLEQSAVAAGSLMVADAAGSSHSQADFAAVAVPAAAVVVGLVVSLEGRCHIPQI